MYTTNWILELSCPYTENEKSETGCFTWQGNNAVLFLQNSKDALALYDAVMENLFKHVNSKRIGDKAGWLYEKGLEQTIDPATGDYKFTPKKDIHSIRFLGAFILNDVYGALSYQFKRYFFKRFEAIYEAEIKETLQWGQQGKSDFMNYAFREFEVFCGQKVKNYHLN